MLNVDPDELKDTIVKAIDIGREDIISRLVSQGVIFKSETGNWCYAKASHREYTITEIEGLPR